MLLFFLKNIEVIKIFFNVVADSGCTQGDIRLVDGAIQQQGRVEICVSGIWSTICATGWDKTNAYVVCQQLGFGQDGNYLKN